MRYWARLILPKCHSLDLPLYKFEHSLRINGFRPTDPTWSSRFFNLIEISLTFGLLYRDQLCLHLSHNKCFWSLLWCYDPVQTHEVYIFKLDYVAHSLGQFSNHIWSKAIHNMSAHQLPWYYQPQRVPTMSWTASAMWYSKEGNQKSPFSIATTLRCRGGCNSVPCIAPLYPWYVPNNAQC